MASNNIVQDSRKEIALIYKAISYTYTTDKHIGALSLQEVLQ